MADLTADKEFQTAVAKARRLIEREAKGGSEDAVALVERKNGKNNLQGHYNSLVPLAVLLASEYPDLLEDIRSGTRLSHNMGRGSYEARKSNVWSPVKKAVRKLQKARGSDVVAGELRSGRPQTVNQVSKTYLSKRYGGSHPHGGGGDTVLKRTLKLLAHDKNKKG